MKDNFAGRLGYLALMAAVAFVVAFALGVSLNAALGPAFGGILNAFATAFVIGVAISGVRTWYSPIVVWLIFSLFAVFTTTMGPPGWHKLVIGGATGAVMALVLVRAKLNVIRYAIAGAIMSALMTFLILFAMLQLNLSPESAQKLQAALPYLIPVYAGLGAAGMAAGVWVYKTRLSRLHFFQKD